MTTREQTTMLVELDIALRLAVKTDLPKLEWYGQYTHFRHLFRRAFREQEQGRRMMVIADCNDFPIGHVFVQLGGGDEDRRAYLYSLRVMEMFRKRGIGTRLIEDAESRLIEIGYRWSTIAVSKTNHGARRLYERLGYMVFRDDPGEWNYRDHEGTTRYVREPCWMMEKELSLH
jgi:ribosomal protein S18 acetylase RimI-like enzyme